ncbi:hypothetical protein MHYP_G00042280 [Metynnis hypsauchen]
MAKYRHAFVSRTKGPDKDAISIVPTSWIIDFDPTVTSRTHYRHLQSTSCGMSYDEHQEACQRRVSRACSGAAVSRKRVYTESTLKTWTCQMTKRPRKPKRLFFDEDEDTETNCEIARKVIDD